MSPWERGRSFQLEQKAPSPALERLVQWHWIVRSDLRRRETFDQEVLPHPSINLVHEPDQTAVWGCATDRQVRTLEGSGWAVGTKFQPGAFTALTGVEAWTLTNRHIPADQAFDHALPANRDAASQEFIESVEALLARHATLDDPAFDLVTEVIDGMRRIPPAARVDDIAGLHHIAPRTLQRIFRRYVGVSPKRVLKRLRIHQAVEQLATRPPSHWTQLALQLGYYDHAHFIRDFRTVVGRSPAAYANEAARAKADRPTAPGNAGAHRTGTHAR